MNIYKLRDYVQFVACGSLHYGTIIKIMPELNVWYYLIDTNDFPIGITVREENIISKIYSTRLIKENEEMEFDFKNWQYIRTVPPKECLENIMREQTEIIDYKVFNDGKAVKVYFKDGTDEVAVCDANDTYDFERAIEVCIMKKRLGGSSAYNGAVRRAMKQIKAIDKQRKEYEDEQIRLANKKQKDIERKIKRREKKRQEQIEIQKEAYLRAMREHDKCFTEKTN